MDNYANQQLNTMEDSSHDGFSISKANHSHDEREISRLLHKDKNTINGRKAKKTARQMRSFDASEKIIKTVKSAKAASLHRRKRKNNIVKEFISREDTLKEINHGKSKIEALKDYINSQS